MRVIALLVVLLSGPVHATVDGWPALHDVAGVAADDVLNIRAAPDSESPILGTFAADARGVEVIRPNEAGTWGLVNIGDGTGWVSLAFLRRRPGQFHGQIPDIAQCFGTEPFWSLALEPPRLTVTLPEADASDGLVSSLWRSRSRPDRFVFDGSLFPDSNGIRRITLALRNGTCTDGMSDREYGYEVDMLVRAESGPGNLPGLGLWSGCCTIARD